MGKKQTKMRVFITGGGGFLGLAIVRKLREQGHDIVSYSRKNHTSLDQSGVRQILGNLIDYSILKQAMIGCEVVFHVAAKTGVWGEYKDFYMTNVVGTKNVLHACRELGVQYLIFTSSASVVYHGKNSEGKNENLPYPKIFNAHYPQTKTIAEKLVMAANDADLKTVSIRPHLIWGPEDPHFLPRLFKKSKSGSLRILGSATNRVDCTYIENAAIAHRTVLDQLLLDPTRVEGKTYFISQDQPIPISELINKLLATGELPPVTKHLSPQIAYLVGWFLGRYHRIFGITTEPVITPFLAQQLSTSHWYDISAAKKDFGYNVEVSLEKGMERLGEWVSKELKALNQEITE